MHRFYLPPQQCDGDTVTLGGAEAHHALRVLRIRTGEAVSVLDGAGRAFTCNVTDTSRGRVQLHIEAMQSVPPLPCAITLVQAIPKGKIIESIIQKATELGVARIVPLITERVVTQLDSEGAAQKAGKWQNIAIEAIKQSGNAWLPKVEAAVALDAYIRRGEPFDLALIGSLQEERRHPREWFEEFSQRHGRIPKTIAAWIGPEGDFSASEVQAARDAGARPITLGRLVLRVETAAIYCLSVLNHEVQWRTATGSAPPRA